MGEPRPCPVCREPFEDDPTGALSEEMTTVHQRCLDGPPADHIREPRPLDVDQLERAIWAYLRSPWYIDISQSSEPTAIRELAEDLAVEYEADDPEHQVEGWATKRA